MLYIAKIDDYLEILTDEKVTEFVAINILNLQKRLRSKSNEEQNLRKVAKLLYIFLTISDEAEKYVHSNSPDDSIHDYNIEIFDIFDPELQLIDTKPMIKNKLKELLCELFGQYSS